jgi:hypothetical protein
MRVVFLAILGFFVTLANSNATVLGNAVGAVVNPYIGAGYSKISNSDNLSGNKNILDNTKLNLGVKVLGIVSLELDYSKYHRAENDSSNTYNLTSQGVNIVLNPPILRFLNVGLEGIIGAGMADVKYKEKLGNGGNSESIKTGKAILGLRLIAPGGVGVYATLEQYTKTFVENGSKPRAVTIGVNYYLF